MDQSKITKDRDIDNLTVTYKVIDYPILDSPPILEDKPIDSEDEYLFNIPNENELDIIPSCHSFNSLFNITITEVGKRSNMYKASAWIDKYFLEYHSIKNWVRPYNRLINRLGRFADKIYTKLHPDYLIGSISLVWKDGYGDTKSYSYYQCPLTIENYIRVSNWLLRDAREWYDNVYIVNYRKELREWYFKKHNLYKEIDGMLVPFKEDKDGNPYMIIE